GNNILQDACNLKKYYTENGNEDMRRTFPKTWDGALVDKVTFEWFCRARLFFQALPDKILYLKNEICCGGKIAKSRLTVLLCVNMIGEFETPLIIGKSLKPRRFKSVNVSTLGVNWKANHKAWMNQDLMTDWLMCFNRKMEMEYKKIILFLDNATSHPDKLNLKNKKLIFLPPNKTSICQPLDQGIIKNVKVHCRQRFLSYILSRVDQNSENKSINLLDAIFWIKSVLMNIKPEAVKNCFKSRDFFRPIQPNRSLENNKYFKNKEDEIALSMVANLQIHCEEQKKFTQKKITDFFNLISRKCPLSRDFLNSGHFLIPGGCPLHRGFTVPVELHVPGNYDIAYERSNSFADRNKADHIILEQRAWDKVQIERFWFKRKSCNLGCDSSAELGEGG
ncbi:tigger transposable element-derived protein 6-like, partial [Aphis craccivora]